MHNHAHIWGWKALITAVADGRWRGSASPRNSRLRALAGPAAPSLRPGRALPLLPAGERLRLLGSRAHLRAGPHSPLRRRLTAPTRRAPEDSAALCPDAPLGLTRPLCSDSSAALARVATAPSLYPTPPRHEEVHWNIKPRRCFGDCWKCNVFQVLRNGFGRIFFLRPGCNRSQFLVVPRYE